LPQPIGLWQFNGRMNWQAVIDLDGHSVAALADRLRELRLSPDVIERVLAAVTTHAPAIAGVTVLAHSTNLIAARNFFVVEMGATSQPRLEVYVY
jgi:hypothetical protein